VLCDHPNMAGVRTGVVIGNSAYGIQQVQALNIGI